MQTSTSDTWAEVPLTSNQFNLLLREAGKSGAILIGGQALAYWVEEYGIQVPDDRAVTTDSDLFGTVDLLRSVGKLLGGHVTIRRGPGFSALVGIVEIPQGAGERSIVDVLHTVAGIDRDGLRKRAVTFESSDGYQFQVMNPIDVLESRLYNITHFHERRVDKYITQCHLAVAVASAYISSLCQSGMEKTALKAIEKIVSMTKVSIGKTAAKHGIKLIDAIPHKSIHNENFHQIRWPSIVAEMSAPAVSGHNKSRP